MPSLVQTPLALILFSKHIKFLPEAATPKAERYSIQIKLSTAQPSDSPSFPELYYNMCGIAGILDVAKGVEARQLQKMASIMSHRGPDQAGFATFAGGQLGLAHVRLAIQDPSAEPQPFVVHIGEDILALCYNGEIYDAAQHRASLQQLGYTFRTRTDTEVLLNLYIQHGLQFLKLLNGEFAFLLYDGRTKQTIAVRDRYGIKPLFFHKGIDRVLFASEAKAILAMPGVPRKFASSFLSYHLWGGFSAFDSPFETISPVPPGHYMIFRDGILPEVRPYWTPVFATNSSMTREEAQAGVRERLRLAVERRLIADVPICSYLSGGIDSALVTGLAAESRPLTAFNISFANSVFDEKEDACSIAAHFGVDFKSIPCSPERLAANLVETIWHTEQFFPNPSAIGKFILSAEVHRQGYKVALTGEGSDEILAGYPTFKIEALWRMLESTNDDLRRRARTLLERFYETEARSEGLLWNKTSSWKSLPRIFGFPNATYLRSATYEPLRRLVLRKGLVRSGSRATDIFEKLDLAGLSRLHPTQASMVVGYNHLASWIFPCLGDRTEMAHHVEGRTPFLDNDLTEFIATIPPEFLIDIERLREKAVLHDAFESFLPDRTASAHKHPFFAPSWASLIESGPGLLLVRDFLSYRALREAGVYQPLLASIAYLVWIHLIPRGTVLFRKLDAVMGVVICVQIMHYHFIASQATAKSHRVPLLQMVRTF